MLDTTKIAVLRSTIRQTQNQDEVLVLKSLLEKEVTNFKNKYSSERFLPEIQMNIKYLKLEVKNLDRKMEYNQIGELQRNLNLFRETLKLGIFMKKTSSCSDY